MNGRTRGRVALACLALCAMVLGGACSSTAEVDRIGLHYTGGPVQGKHFKKVIQPGSGQTLTGVFDTVAWLKAGQRNYIVSKHATEGDRKGADVITVPAKGGVLMDFELAVYFKLNTHTDDVPGYRGGTLRRFYEQICKKYHCTEEKGWDELLNDNLRKIIETSMNERIRQYDPGVLYANNLGTEGQASTDVLLAVQRDVGSTLGQRVNDVLGGPFFCGPKFDRATSECPPLEFIINSAIPASGDTLASFEAIRRSQNDIAAAENRAKAVEAEGRGEAAKQTAIKAAGELTPSQIAARQAQAQIDCANNKDGHCVLVVGASNVNVSTAR